MKLIEEIKYRWWKRNFLNQELKSVYRQLNAWEAKKLKEEDAELREKYKALKDPFGLNRKPEEIYADIVRVSDSIKKETTTKQTEFLRMLENREFKTIKDFYMAFSTACQYGGIDYTDFVVKVRKIIKDTGQE